MHILTGTAYSLCRVDPKLIQGDRNNIFRGFYIHSQTKKVQYTLLKDLKIAFRSVLVLYTSYISCNKKLILCLIEVTLTEHLISLFVIRISAKSKVCQKIVYV